MFFTKNVLFVSMLAALSAGCASVSTSSMAKKVSSGTDAAKQSLTAGNYSRVATRVSNEPYISASPTDYIPVSAGNVTMTAGSAEVYQVIYGIADQAKYSVMMMDNVDGHKRINVDIRNQTTDQAIRDIALSAGYVAIIDKAKKTVTLAERGTYTFKLPASVFQPLAGNYNVNGNAQGSGSGSGSSSSSGATFTVSGSMKTGDGTKDMKETLKEIVGPDGTITIHQESALISVRAPAQQLRRVQSFLDSYIKDAMSQIEIKASIIEVSLGDDFQMGIDWARVLPKASSLLNVGLSTASGVAAPALTAQYTGANIDAVIKALEKYSEVRVLTQPSMMATNHSPTVLFDGQQIPYLGSVQQSITGTSGTVTQTGTLSYAMDGISIGIKPNIIDAARAQITMVPLISTVNGFQEFTVGGTTMKAPNQPTRQAHIQVIAEHGKTMVVGGSRSGRDTTDRTGIPGLPGNPIGKFFGGRSDSASQKEMVFLIHTNIIPAPKYDCLVAESI